VRDEVGISHNPPHNTHNNRKESVLLNRFLFRKFTDLSPLAVDSKNRFEKSSWEIKWGKSTVRDDRGRALRNT
jgi:hypothetical protein